MSGALDGFRIVDISERSLPAAVGGMLLSDLGANVIRVEPSGGDPIRALNGVEVWFRGQRSVTVGAEQVRDGSWLALRSSADVLITTEQPWTAKPDLLEGWGDDPRQILAVLTASPRRPDEVPGHSLEPVYGELAEARLGWPFFQDAPREGPAFLAWPHAAFGAAWLLQIGILAALFDRERTGLGQTVTTSLVDGLAILGNARYLDGTDELTSGLSTRSTIDTRLNSSRKMVVKLFECADGEWVHVHTGARGSFQRLMIALDRLDLVVDETSSVELDPQVGEELYDFLEATFKTEPSDHWVQLLNASDICCMPALPPGAALWLEQAEANQMVDVAADGSRQIGRFAKFARTPVEVGHGVPEPGQDSEQLLRENAPLQWQPTKPVEPAGVDRVGPLAGVTLVDFGFWLAGPFSPRVLADLGARVIKVEEVVGDPVRRAGGGGAGFLTSNRGKEAIALNLKTDAGRAVAYDLIRQADVVHHNLRKGSLGRLGIEYETLSGMNPQLVYLHSSGYGNDGPWSSLPTLEPLHSALSGLLVRTAGEGNPPAHYLTHMDYGCALTSTIAVLAALIERERSGKGQYVEVVQTMAGLYAMSDVHGTREQLRESFALDHDLRGHAPTNAMYGTSDGSIVIACYSDQEWQGLRRALGVSPVLWPGYAAARQQPFAGSEAARTVEQLLSPLSSAEAQRRLRAEGVPHVSLSPVTVKQATNDPALQELHVMVAEEHPEMGEMIEVGHTVRFGGAEQASLRPAPTLGQDTVRIMRELGTADDAIESLIESGAAVAHADGPKVTERS